jgi:hypothetical protein
MAKIVIKRKIDLDFLGKEYEGGFVEFKALTIKDVENQIDAIAGVGDDNKKAMSMIIQLLQDHFIGGEFVSGEDKQTINAEDIQDFDVPSIYKFFNILSGQVGEKKD